MNEDCARPQEGRALLGGVVMNTAEDN